MNKLKLSIISYIIAIILFIIYLYYLFMPKLSMDPSEKAIFLLFVCIFNYFGSLFLTKYLNNNKPLKINLKVSLILYIFLLIDLVIFDFERGEITLIFNNESWQSYIDIFVNLVPFKTIKRFFNAFGRINSRYLIYNLLGNLICLMPLSLLLPKIYKVQNKFFIFTITILLTTLAIEVTQLITCTGFFDIDDIILNASGALIAYLILKIKPLARSTSKIFLLERSNYEKN
ncbi:MAG: VanZ family protein [Bacilli bacterium]|jgi:glycopeptide antibiotics resistance protein|nr:VanZ family protein [Bacilli bacterium]